VLVKTRDGQGVDLKVELVEEEALPAPESGGEVPQGHVADPALENALALGNLKRPAIKLFSLSSSLTIRENKLECLFLESLSSLL
jgi:hypothetical protein